MAIPTPHRNGVAIHFIPRQLRLRKSLKRKSKRAQQRKRTNQSTRIARSLITPSLLKENVRVNHVSIIRSQASSVKKNKDKIEQRSFQTYTSDQQHIDINEDEHDQRRDSKNNTEIHDTADSHDQHLNVSGSSNRRSINIKLTVDKIVSQAHHGNLSSQSYHYIPPFIHLPKGNVHHDVNLFQDTTSNLTPSLIDKTFSILTRSNKISSVQLNIEEQNQHLLQKKKKRRISPYIIILVGLLSFLLISAIAIAIVVPLTSNKNKTTALPTILSTTAAVACTTSNYTACSTVLYHDLNSGLSSAGSWISISCCYIAPTTNQTTIKFAIRDDTGTWMIDDVSAIQGNRELVSNGGFEYNLLNWTLTADFGAIASIAADNSTGNQRTGTSFLSGASGNAFSYVAQTFSIIQGQNILVNYWWNYFPGLGAGSGISEINATLT